MTDRAAIAASDPGTVAYFDDHIPEYGSTRLRYAAEYLSRNATPDSSLIDLGCGVGNTLAYLAENTPIKNLAALDVSQNCLTQTEKRLGCETVLGSVVDTGIAERLRAHYDYAVVAAVLHHLVGRTRTESRENAMTAVRNALTMLKPGGVLIVHEPVLRSKPAMFGLFHTKRAVARISGNRRVPVLGYWGNVGAPVVSYYSDRELQGMIATAGGRVVEHWVQSDPPKGVLGAALKALDRKDVTLAVKAA